MRRSVWVLVGIAVLAAAWTWVPSAVVQRQVAVALRGRLESAGSVTVRARATLTGLVRRRINWIEIDARGVRLGDLAAERLTATLEGVSFRRGPGGVGVVHHRQARPILLGKYVGMNVANEAGPDDSDGHL